MHHHPRAHDLLVGQLMRAADELQDQVNQLIGLAVVADIEVPDVLHETNAELVRLTAQDPRMTSQPSPRVSDLLDHATVHLRAGVSIDEAALAISIAKSLLAVLVPSSGQHGVLAPVELHRTTGTLPRWAVALQEQRSHARS